jgi:hypothetical protein
VSFPFSISIGYYARHAPGLRPSRAAQCYNHAVPADPPLTKRQLGWLIVAGGVLLATATLSADLLGAGRFGGLGPAQRQALAAAGLAIAFGLTLVPLGRRPA